MSKPRGDGWFCCLTFPIFLSFSVFALIPLKQIAMGGSSEDSGYCLRLLATALTSEGDGEVGEKIQGEMDLK